jgi:excisionase family DNA binding protein
MSELFSLKQAAAYADVSSATARRWIDENKLAVIRINRILRIRRCDLDDFLESHRTQPASQNLDDRAVS